VEEYCPWSGMSPLHVASNRVYERCPIQIFRASQHDADAQIGRLMDYIRSDDNLKTNTFVIMSGGTLQAYKLHRLIPWCCPVIRTSASFDSSIQQRLCLTTNLSPLRTLR
jgi:hypothetical protein